MIAKVISGGQTGADQAGLRAARNAHIPTGGYAPLGWQTETGPAPWLADFGLVEHNRHGYPARTKANVGIATALIWFGSPHSPGGKLTLREATSASPSIDVFVVISQSTPQEVVDWLRGMVFPGEDEVTLMIAGNRESSAPGIGAQAARQEVVG